MSCKCPSSSFCLDRIRILIWNSHPGFRLLFLVYYGFLLRIDPDPDPDPDPAQHFSWIPVSIPIYVLTTKIDKKLQLRKNSIFLSKTAIYLSLGLHKGSKLQEKPSALKREHPALKNMKFLKLFLFLWVIFALQDPDPLTWLNHDPIRIRIQIRNTGPKTEMA